MSDNREPKSLPLAVDYSAESSSATEPAFIARPAGALVYHGFRALNDVTADGFTFGMITDFESKPATYGDAFVIAPDNSRAGLVWEIGEQSIFREILPIAEDRWGVWEVSFPEPMASREAVRRNLSAIVPELKEQWLKWRGKYGKPNAS